MSLQEIKDEMLKRMNEKMKEAEMLKKAKPELRERICKVMREYVKITKEICEVEEP